MADAETYLLVIVQYAKSLLVPPLTFLVPELLAADDINAHSEITA